MRVVVLGSAAGGIVPQWNCTRGNCQAARRNAGPILREGSPERPAVEARGWAVAEDGLEIVL